MVLTLLIAGTAVTLGFLCVVISQATSPALASEQTMVGLGDPASETLGHDPDPPAAVRNDWQMTTLDDLTDAEDLLDCLENQGVEDRELVILGDSSFAVRWR